MWRDIFIANNSAAMHLLWVILRPNFQSYPPTRTIHNYLYSLSRRLGLSREDERVPAPPAFHLAYLEGYLAHKKPPTPLGPPQGPRRGPTVGSRRAAIFYKQRTPAQNPTHQTVSTPPALPLIGQLGQGPCCGWLFLSIPAIT